GAARPAASALRRHVPSACRRPQLETGGVNAGGRAGRARGGAGVGLAARARRRAAGRPRVPRRVLTVDARAVALVERAGVAVGGARRARRLLRVGRTVRPVGWAVLLQVTLPCPRPALDTGAVKDDGRAAPARAR